jgi:hypothetical protein
MIEIAGGILAAVIALLLFLFVAGPILFKSDMGDIALLAGAVCLLFITVGALS